MTLDEAVFKCCNFIVFRCENGSTNLLHTFGVSTAVQ